MPYNLAINFFRDIFGFGKDEKGNVKPFSMGKFIMGIVDDVIDFIKGLFSFVSEGPSIKERLRRKEEHLYNVPTEEYTDSYFENIVTQCHSPASRIRITKLAPGKTIPWHVDYDVSYGVRVIVPIYGDNNVILPGGQKATSGQYFCYPCFDSSEDQWIAGNSSFVTFTRLGYLGQFVIGGPVENSGRLCYIDGCSDSLLIYPPRLEVQSKAYLKYHSQ